MREFPKRGEIYLVCLDPTIGSEINKSRPALIISNDINNDRAPTVTVIPITSNTEKTYPFETLIASRESGLSKKSKAKCNQIRTIDKLRLQNLIGKITPEELEYVEKALLIHLGISYSF
jgi:mRNA interferase MazF